LTASQNLNVQWASTSTEADLITGEGIGTTIPSATVSIIQIA
jgi:hypothetical protein